MKWIKKGLIYKPAGKSEWMNNSVLTPQPFLINDEVIRIYASFRDINGIGRIGYLDLAASDPKNILYISQFPVLDIGNPGQFNDNGIILGDVLRVHDSIRMYYVSFQKVDKIKFYAFSGLAISYDNGNTFLHYSRVPIMDRSEEGIFGRCIHCVIFSGNLFRVWYTSIFDWYFINNKPYPSYNIKYMESEDGLNFCQKGELCVSCEKNEYRIGRPKVNIINHDQYEMLYTVGTKDHKSYNMGYAKSTDGIHWIREDNNMNVLRPSSTGFDSKSVNYPVTVTTKYGTYMFYSGNDMGKEGFGYAELSQEN